MALAPLKSTWKVLALFKLSINYSIKSPCLFFCCLACLSRNLDLFSQFLIMLIQYLKFVSQTKCKDYLVLHVNKNCRLSNYRHRNLKIPKNLKKKFLHRGVQIIKGLNVPAFGSKGEFNIRSRVPFCLIPLNLSLSLFKTKKLEDITVSEQCRFFS